jgi:hypothetical protein
VCVCHSVSSVSGIEYWCGAVADLSFGASDSDSVSRVAIVFRHLAL